MNVEPMVNLSCTDACDVQHALIDKYETFVVSMDPHSIGKQLKVSNLIQIKPMILKFPNKLNASVGSTIRRCLVAFQKRIEVGENGFQLETSIL